MSVHDDDRIAAARRHDAMIDQLDRDIAEMKTADYQAEVAVERAAAERWGGLPPVRLRPGVKACRLTDAESFLMDRSGY